MDEFVEGKGLVVGVGEPDVEVADDVLKGPDVGEDGTNVVVTVLDVVLGEPEVEVPDVVVSGPDVVRN